MSRTLRLLSLVSIIAVLASADVRARQLGSVVTPAPEPQPTIDPVTGPRDRPREASGTARISGRVVAADTGRPLRRARVQIQGEHLPEGRSASTDDYGRYLLDEVPAGKYGMTAAKGGYVATGHGHIEPFEAPRHLEVARGQKLQNVDFVLMRGGVIAGRITDDVGEPVPNIGVRALRSYRMHGRRILVPGGSNYSSSTDDLGEYRIFGLPPGDYYVSASALDTDHGGGMHLMDHVEGALRTYFPGSANLAEARRIRVGAGEDVLSVNFALVAARPLTIGGRILDSTGQRPAHASVMVEHSTDLMGFSAGANVAADGTFTVKNLSPAAYVLHVRAGNDEEAAVVPVDLSAGDITDLTIVTSPGTTISGQLLFETEPRQPVNPEQFQFMAVSATAAALLQGGHFAASVDWTFEVRVHQAPVLIRTNTLPEPWVVKAVLQDGVDVTDTGIDIGRGRRVEGVRILLSTRASTVSGIVRDERGRIVSNCAVVVFADDSSLWGPYSRYLHAGRPSQEGRYEIGHLPPGHYATAAVPYLDGEQHGDPDYLERLRPYATPFQIGEGEQRTLDLQVVNVR